MNFNINDDDDEFAPNPFRSSNANDFLGTPNPPPRPNPPPLNNHINNQPDPYSGMTGTLDMSPGVTPQQQQQPPPLQQQHQQQPRGSPDPALWSGTLDQRGAAVESYGGMAPPGQNGQAGQAAPFNFFSLRSWTMCCSVEPYKQYFDVDTVDIQERLKASLFKFYEPDQFRTAVVGDEPTETLKGPDLYGPVWIVMTFVFILAATSNIYAFWEHHKAQKAAKEGDTVEEFEVDIKHLLRAGNVVAVFVFGMSSAFWLAATCMGMPGISWGLWVCVYGYSQMPFMVASILVCIFPIHILTWLLIILAGVASGMLVLRNLATPLMGQEAVGSSSKAAPIILAMLGVHIIYVFVIKLTFYF